VPRLVYSPDDPGEPRDAHVILFTELPGNPGSSVTNSAEVIAAEAIARSHLPARAVFIEHYPRECRDSYDGAAPVQTSEASG
jgi:hypothetical protein